MLEYKPPALLLIAIESWKRASVRERELMIFGNGPGNVVGRSKQLKNRTGKEEEEESHIETNRPCRYELGGAKWLRDRLKISYFCIKWYII